MCCSFNSKHDDLNFNIFFFFCRNKCFCTITYMYDNFIYNGLLSNVNTKSLIGITTIEIPCIHTV